MVQLCGLDYQCAIPTVFPAHRLVSSSVFSTELHCTSLSKAHIWSFYSTLLYLITQTPEDKLRTTSCDLHDMVTAPCDLPPNRSQSSSLKCCALAMMTYLGFPKYAISLWVCKNYSSVRNILHQPDPLPISFPFLLVGWIFCPIPQDVFPDPSSTQRIAQVSSLMCFHQLKH